jgi:hypothetical protein
MNGVGALLVVAVLVVVFALATRPRSVAAVRSHAVPYVPSNAVSWHLDAVARRERVDGRVGVSDARRRSLVCPVLRTTAAASVRNVN